MPRKAFLADLQEASRKFVRSNVSGIEAGEDDGQVAFRYAHHGTSTEIIALVPELGDYPESHSYMFFTNSNSIEPTIHKAIDNLPECAKRKVPDMLGKVVSCLDKATVGSSNNPVNVNDGADDVIHVDSDAGSEFQDQDEDEDDGGRYDSDDEAWSSKPARPRLTDSKKLGSLNDNEKLQRARLRHDLRLARDSGFRLGNIGCLANGGRDGFISLSIRVAKLGISEEALDAWNMEPSQYFIILLRYAAGYQSFDNLVGNSQCGIQIRVGLSSRYKVTVDEAIDAFARLEDKGKSKKQLFDTTGEGQIKGLGRLFIGRPLEELLNDRLIPLLKYRIAMGFPWLGAEEFLNDHQGRNLESDAPDPKYWAEETAKPGIANMDHLMGREKKKSFPLLAMQYALRHLVRCTEFCLVCHCKAEADFEALKPYVCSKPLCLYQYMSLGFGPSIEHEVITQPYVVDLLVSFCYASAYSQRLKYLPTGMALMVPPPNSMTEYETQEAHSMYTGRHKRVNGPSDVATTPMEPYKGYEAKFDKEKLELVFPSEGPRIPLQVGSWVSIKKKGVEEERYHCRVIEMMYPIARLATPVRPPSKNSALDPTSSLPHPPFNQLDPTAPKPVPTPPPAAVEVSKSAYEIVDFVIWDLNFDDLNKAWKYSTMCMLLDTLPTVPAMRNFLLSKGGQEVSLRQWAEKIPPAALGLLRWIIASNRSCIVQVDSLEGVSRKSEGRVCGMPGWMQFRFAQGAPDKEQRFITSIRDTTATSKHPTIFAWHGSPLYNWHGIVREGLHFERTDHGRAYGNGVYHAMDVSTSLGYTGGYGGYSHGGVSSRGDTSWTPGQWFNSQLRISSAMALNEIINAPTQFVSHSPFLVVAQLDWIQSRYLFVKINVEGWQIPDSDPSQLYDQDPKYHPRGMSNTSVKLPMNAVSKSRRPKSAASAKIGNKKVKTGQETPGSERFPIDFSDETDFEELEVFFSDEEPEPTTGSNEKGPPVPPKVVSVDHTKTDFEPKTLDASSLTLLEPPSYATSMATKALQRELQSTMKIQDTHPLHELGWYINPELVSNVYQWIVELHSFENDLPLAKDMKKRGIKSIVMEIRFGAQYPMSPPFVRILRPRFLSFNQGGGGHVTIGGALCMELLTNTGWSAVSNIESVLLQVRLAMSSTDPKPARLLHGPSTDYGVGEAVEAYIRACQAHGWQVPPDFRANYAGAIGSSAFF